MKNRKRFKLKSNKVVNIFPISDVHYGSPQCNIEYFEYMLNKFDNTKGYKIIYLLGDLMDFATKRLGNSAYRQMYTVEEQLQYFIDTLKPYKNNIRGVVTGNHEARAKKEFDLDVTKILSEALGLDYCKEIYDTFCINNEPYKIWGTHGTKTSQQQHLMMGNVERQTNHIDANLYLYGHCHYLTNWSSLMKNGEDYKRKYYLLTGHYLNYSGSYAQDKLLKPSLPCFAKVTINKNLRTNVEQYHFDEMDKGYFNNE